MSQAVFLLHASRYPVLTMSREKPMPGITRSERLSDEGLGRLESHLQQGTAISRAVLAQWVRRYGEAARAIIRRHGQDGPDLDVR
jgi:hypothetical protein